MGWIRGYVALLWRRAGSLMIPVSMAAVALGLVLAFPREGGTGARRSLPLTSVTPAPVQLKVYITGAVQQPGVYTLDGGDRLDDLLRLAGGPAPEADLEAVNLAARLRDAQRVHIPRIGEAGEDTLFSGPLVNLNTAPQALLETLPDIGPVRAQRIIESRTRDGPFGDPQDLVTRKIISERTLARLRDRVMVR